MYKLLNTLRPRPEALHNLLGLLRDDKEESRVAQEVRELLAIPFLYFVLHVLQRLAHVFQPSEDRKSIYVL